MEDRQPSAASTRPETLASAEALVERTIEKVGRKIVLGLPLGLGKANHIANAFYRRAKSDPSLRLTIFTALTLERPAAPNGLAKRLLGPISDRLYADYPDLDYASDRRKNALPENVTVKEFYLAPGQLLGTPYAQRNYVSVNYTHAVGALIDLGVNVIAQMAAPATDGSDRLSLSCNPDLSLDIVDHLRAQEREGRPVAVLGEINHELPFLGGDAAVDPDWFDFLYEAGSYRLFATVPDEVKIADYALGLFASALVKDAGTLQLGIGALADAVGASLILRHRKPERHRALLDALNAHVSGLPPETAACGDDGAFSSGLYGCSEMVTEPLIALLQEGVIARAVTDDSDGAAIKLHGGFYLGPPSLYERLRTMSEADRASIGMTRVSRINQLYGGEEWRRQTRSHARFINTTMKITGLGAAVSDTLADGRVVSGVGGQYNFVAMAQELEGARSILLVRAVREKAGDAHSNIVWHDDGEVTIPRHLRDIVVTEYGVADLRAKSDREVIIALAKICDIRFQARFLDAAKAAGKLERSYELPEASCHNRPARLAQALRPARAAGDLPPFPFGTPLTPVEIELRRALEHLSARNGGSLARRSGLIASAILEHGRMPEWAEPHLARMGLAQPPNWRAWFDRRLVLEGLNQTRMPDDIATH